MAFLERHRRTGFSHSLPGCSKKGWLMSSRWLSFLLALVVLLICGCSSSGPPPQQIAVSVTPTTATVRTGDTQQFFATVTGTTNQSQRSEEHTSELQSHLNLVCRLLLDKKQPDVPITVQLTHCVVVPVT